MGFVIFDFNSFQFNSINILRVSLRLKTLIFEILSVCESSKPHYWNMREFCAFYILCLLGLSPSTLSCILGQIRDLWRIGLEP